MGCGSDQRDAGAGRDRRIASCDAAPDTGRTVSGSHKSAKEGVRDPMMLLRVQHAELLKMKRTIALKMVVIAPAVVVVLILFMASQSPFTTVNRHGIKNEWTELAALILRFWAVLMLPLYIALETALLAGLDHEGNQWKSLLARPVPRWTLYVAKLIVAAGMTVGSASGE